MCVDEGKSVCGWTCRFGPSLMAAREHESSLMHSPTLFFLLRKRPLPSPDRTEPVLNTGVMFDRQFRRLFFFTLLFYLHSLGSQGAPPLWDGGMKWEEQGREWAGEWIKRLLFFFICAFFYSVSFSLFSQPAFSLAVLDSGSPGPGPISGRHRCGAEVSLRFFGLINFQQADKTEKFKVEIQL